MSTSPDTGPGADDRIVNVLSQWLARHVDSAELLRELERVGAHELDAVRAEAVDELLDALRRGATGGELEMVVRETLEALALA